MPNLDDPDLLARLWLKQPPALQDPELLGRMKAQLEAATVEESGADLP